MAAFSEFAGEDPLGPAAGETAITEQHPKRFLSLDVLRAIAVLSALLVSVWWFAGFSLNQQAKLLSHPFGSNYRLFAGVSLLLEGKMRALIALVFGAGIILFLSTQKTPGKLSVADLFFTKAIMADHLWVV